MTQPPDAPIPDDAPQDPVKEAPQGPKLRDTLTSLENRLTAIERSVTVLAEAELEKDRPRPQLISRSVSWLERHWATRLTFAVASLAALGAILFSAYQFDVEQDARAEEREARRAEAGFRKQAQVSAAWETLLQRVGGNTGKGGALELILDEQQSLSLVDLSCANIGTYVNGFCVNPPVFDFGANDHFRPLPGPVRVVEDEPWYASLKWPWDPEFTWPWAIDDIVPEIVVAEEPRKWLEGIDFSKTTMLYWWMTNADLRDIDLRDVTGRFWTLEEIDFHFSSTTLLEGLTCERCDFYLSNHVPWQFVTQLERPTFPLSTVIFPHDTTITRDGDRVRLRSESRALDMTFESGPEGSTLMDDWWWREMPLFLKADAPHPAGKNPWGITEPLRTPADQNIFWDFYDAQSLCLPAVDIFEAGITLPDDIRARTEARHGRPITPETIAEYYSDPDLYIEICGLTTAHPEIKPHIEEFLMTEFTEREFPGVDAKGETIVLSFSCETEFDLSDPELELPIEGCAEEYGMNGSGF